MWVVKLPKRRDFCGCVGCHLCFVWVEENKAPVDAVEKMAQDLLGRLPNDLERKQLEDASDKLHNDAVVQKSGLLVKDDPGGAAVESPWLRKEVDQVLKRNAKIIEAKKNAPKKLNTVNLDSIAEEKESREKEEKYVELKEEEKYVELKEEYVELKEEYARRRWVKEQRQTKAMRDADAQRRIQEVALKELYEKSFDPETNDFRKR